MAYPVITVDASQVNMMIANTLVATSGPALAAFLGQTIDPFIRQRAADRFASEGDQASGKWAALKPATVEIRQNLGFPGAHPINRRTGELENYITKTPGVTAAASPTTASLTYLDGMPNAIIGSKVRKAQRGGTAPKGGTTPPRPVMALGAEDLGRTMKYLELYILKAGGWVR